MKFDKTDIRRVRVGYTHNCGNYESVRLDLEFELETPETKHLDENLDDYIKELTAYVQSECRKMAPEYRVKAIELEQISKQLHAARQAIIAIEEIAGQAPILAVISNYASNAKKNLLELGYIQPTKLDKDEEPDEDEVYDKDGIPCNENGIPIM